MEGVWMDVEPAPGLGKPLDVAINMATLIVAYADGTTYVREGITSANPGCTRFRFFAGPLNTVTVNEIVSCHGPRIHNTKTSHRDFRMAHIVASQYLLNATEMSFFDFPAAVFGDEDQQIEQVASEQAADGHVGRTDSEGRQGDDDFGDRGRESHEERPHERLVHAELRRELLADEREREAGRDYGSRR